MANAPVRLAIVGARRGRAGRAALKALPEKVQLIALCDPDESVHSGWREEFPNVRLYTSFEQVLRADDVDAVLIATPLLLHPEQALMALRAGKHVLTEVPACYAVEQCWELVETVESTGLVYMMAENYCFMRPNMMVHNMVQAGLFGDLVHAEGAYIHDCKPLTHDTQGNLTWRGEINRIWNSVTYPTHSFGPVCQWLGINRPGGDRLVSMVAVTTAPRAMHHYYRDMFGGDHPGADPNYWSQGDSQVAVITTERGATITLRVDWVSSRPHNMTHYGLQGTEAAYLSERHPGEDPLIWIGGASSKSSREKDEAVWEALWNYEDQYEHPLWKRWRNEATNAGHGGGDFFVLEEFVASILEKRRPAIDVYDAVTWSSLIPLSAKSASAGGRPVSIPDFKVERESLTNGLSGGTSVK